MSHAVSLETLFTNARTQRAFLDKPLPPGLLSELYELCKWGPTALNSCPARFIFVTSRESRDRLAQCASEGNRERIVTAPATVIIAQDEKFYEQLPLLAPHAAGAAERFAANPQMAAESALRNSTLQGAYLMLAARGLGLDCAPMLGFDKTAVNQAFLSSTHWTANFICCLGYGDYEKLNPRAARLSFAEACREV